MQRDLPFYAVEQILDRKLIDNKVYYLVKWKDFPLQDATWEHSRTLPYIRPLIRQFNANAKTHIPRSRLIPNTSAILSQHDSNAEPHKRPHHASPSRLDMSANLLGEVRRRERSPAVKRGGRVEKKVERERPKKRAICEAVDQLGRGLDLHSNSHQSSINLGGETVGFGLPQSAFQEEPEEEEEEKMVNSKPVCIKRLPNPDQPIEIASRADSAEKEKGAVRRVCLLRTASGEEGVEFLVEMERGQFEILPTRQLMERYPDEMARFVERFITNSQK